MQQQLCSKFMAHLFSADPLASDSFTCMHIFIIFLSLWPTTLHSPSIHTAHNSLAMLFISCNCMNVCNFHGSLQFCCTSHFDVNSIQTSDYMQATCNLCLRRYASLTVSTKFQFPAQIMYRCPHQSCIQQYFTLFSITCPLH